MAEILGPGFIDTIFKELVTKKLTMQGNIDLNQNDMVNVKDIKCKSGAGGSIGYGGAIDFDRVGCRNFYTGGGGWAFTSGKTINLNSDKLYGVKTFTTSPALADMSVGEIALGDGTGTGGLDEWFFKPDTAKIVALASDGSARTITT